jgi:hypothetical protein
MTLRRPTCPKCGKESCGHKQQTFGEMWAERGKCIKCGDGWMLGRKCETCTYKANSTSDSSGTVSKRLGSELQKLHTLFVAGALTKDEFEKDKQKLIGD